MLVWSQQDNRKEDYTLHVHVHYIVFRAENLGILYRERHIVMAHRKYLPDIEPIYGL